MKNLEEINKQIEERVLSYMAHVNVLNFSFSFFSFLDCKFNVVLDKHLSSCSNIKKTPISNILNVTK